LCTLTELTCPGDIAKELRAGGGGGRVRRWWRCRWQMRIRAEKELSLSQLEKE